jgi:DNA-directed RNA polymerase subunit RPC12/RpoP
MTKIGWEGYKAAVKEFDYIAGKSSETRFEVDCPDCSAKLVIEVKDGNVAIVECSHQI